jgi:hypothetical protein
MNKNGDRNEIETAMGRVQFWIAPNFSSSSRKTSTRSRRRRARFLLASGPLMAPWHPTRISCHCGTKVSNLSAG